MPKNLYETLGVPVSASAEEIKAAYRAAARKWHPDANRDDPSAAERFSAAAAAYEVLSDPARRELYDQEISRPSFDSYEFPFASSGQDFSHIFTSSIFEDLFTRPTSRRGQDVSASVSVPFKDVITGAKIPLRMVSHGPCQDCGASGSNGYGLCASCAGTGIAQASKKVTVRIPPGVQDGTTLRIRGKGEPGMGSGPPGDLLLTVLIDPDPVFSTTGKDVRVRVPVSFAEAAGGATILVPTPRGSRVKMRVPPGTGNGRVLRIKGKGLRPPKSTPGDLLVVIEVVVPSSLNRQQKEALDLFQDSSVRDDLYDRTGTANP